jgi:rhamnulose-1-phosphate aldolase/alcohol dehydrogenase
MENRWDDRAAAALTDELAELIYLSHLVGADVTLTQPGGGNSSVKRRELDFTGRPVDVLRVKGSGTDLATIGAAGFSGLRMEDLAFLRKRETMTDEQMMAFMAATMLDTRAPAPSVETPLHAALDKRFIIHTHDFATQALTDTAHPRELVRDALGEEVVYVDYVRPGFPLAHAVLRMGPLPDQARGMVLGQHGLVAWGDTAKECYANLHRLITRAEGFIGARGEQRQPFGETKVVAAAPARRREAALDLLPSLRGDLARVRPVILHLDDSPEALAFAGAARAPEVAGRGMATPEHILRCGRLPLFVDADLGALHRDDARRAVTAALDRYADEHRAANARHPLPPGQDAQDPSPRVIALPGLGLVTAMKDKANAVVGNVCYRHYIKVADAAERLGGFRFLDEADALAFENWPLEVVKLKQPERELARQVALITGAASGIGRAIAEKFAAEGAHLVLTDVEAGPLRATADAIAAACRDPHRVTAVEADATRPEDAARAVAQAVLTFGGVDILVGNAGFVQAGPIDQMDDAVWTRHYDVNVRGQFLAVREAVKVMKAQRRGVILFNASKGAFAPTADNAAYASSKAAVAALARNLAVELGPHDIRVNYFNADFIDTPLMRKLIEQRAGLKGTTPEAQLAAYRERNLMHVGPIPVSAVAEAALFLVSSRSRYTTGAALPIDGGIKEAMPR